jgi:L-alanine-DL-glutamate epimerase-like enolase superfamily enzyme
MSTRRTFLRAAAPALWAGDTLDAALAFTSTASKPSALRITDLRVAVVKDAPMLCPLVRIDTNQGISGLGEVRDGATKTYALMLKSRLVGENPCDVDRIFRKIRQFAGHGRQGGGVSGIEMALWDLAGKAYNVPVYQMLGGRFRDRIRCYADTNESHDPVVYGQRLRGRRNQGFTWLKMDLGIDLLDRTPGTVTAPLGASLSERAMTQHPFTGVELTDSGIARICDYVTAVRAQVGWDVPLSADHFGHIGVNSCIRLGKALEKFNLAWLEDMVPWQFPALLKQITDQVSLPTCTGEDIFGKETFLALARDHVVDILHPDLATAGGILETKKIGDAIQEYGVPMAMHFAGSPVACMANVHCAAATENVLVLENHSVDIAWWDSMVEGIPKPIVNRGYISVPEGPGLGIRLNDEVVRQHLAEPGYFAPTEEWNNERPWDRTWS